jgi:ribonuclease P protein component
LLAKSERLRLNGLFQQAYEKGRTLHSAHLRLTYTKSRPELINKFPLVGFAVSKNFSKKAVLRNKIKRRLREIYRSYRNDPINAGKLKPLGLLVIGAKPGADPKSSFYGYQNLKIELEALFEKLR